MPRKLSAKKPRRVWMFPGWYKVITSPDPLFDADNVRCQALPVRSDKVLWLDPSLSPDEREEAIQAAAIHAWQSRELSRRRPGAL